MSNIFHPNGIRSVSVSYQNSDLKLITKNWKDYVNNIPSYPDNFEGAGIVICAGGVNYFTCCWVLVNMLRKEHKCKLPIQVWYVGNEMTQEVIDSLKELDVSCHNFLDHEENFEMKGYMLKPLAIKLSSFKEVLYLDADNVPVKDPEFLFQATEYKGFGAVFWPDFWQTSDDNQIWKIIESKPIAMKEQESGQLLINKEKCWKELNLAVYFNRNSFVYYNLLLGDKDTFRFAWLALKSNFYFINHEVSSCGYISSYGKFLGHTMVQYTPDGQICFLHRNLLKWSITNPESVSWVLIKRFKKNACYRQYAGAFGNGHLSVNLEGDVETLIFQHLFGNMEKICLQYLCNLKEEKFYKDFLEYSKK
jgi:alpha 1,2-mannosyltransferase